MNTASSAGWLREITRPTLIVQEQRVRRNIERMAEKARRSGVRFRPHFKTHQSAQVGEWFRDYGVEAITVSSVSMAGFFADQGWKDITVAFPVNLREMEFINALAGRVRLNLLVESPEVVEALARRLQHPVGVWIKVDVGAQRTGIPWQEGEALQSVAAAVRNSRRLKLMGLLTHAGHTYQARSPEAIRRIHREAVRRIRQAQSGLKAAGFTDLEISIGDTPACSVVEDFSEVEEIRPGNFVYYDLMQVQIGACTEGDIAAAVACPVVAKHLQRGEAVLYGGAVHLSKEVLIGEDGSRCFGVPAWPEDNGWSRAIEGARIRSLSQEHGVVQLPTVHLHRLGIGDILMVLPVHSCLTANLLKSVRVI